jgi:hypothetical protein
MSSSDPTPTLRALVDGVDEAFWSDGSPGPALLRVVGPGGAAAPDISAGSGRFGEPFELAMRPLDGGHPLDALLGFVAPPGWAALGVATPGTGHALDGDRPSERVHVTMLLARSGASASVLRRGDEATRLGEPPQGLVADACRRALGLPTAAPPPTTAGLWARWWLDRLVQSAAGRAGGAPVPGWADAIALHPAGFVPSPGEPAPEPAAVAAATLGLADAWPWGRLRARPEVADLLPGPVPSALTPDVAGWMDDGMFARWLLAGLPPAGDLLDACWALLPEAVAARVAATVAGIEPQPEAELYPGPGSEKAVAR